MMSKLPLAKLREVLGYTQQDMADRLAVKLLAISKIEGNGNPSLRRLWRYAYAPRLRGPRRLRTWLASGVLLAM